MTEPTVVHPLVSPWGRFGLHSYFIDAPEPAIVDTGIASSPVDGMVPELEQLGRRIEDVRWILLTHGHIDHLGGAHALWELTGRRAQVVIHEADAHLLRSRRAHVAEYEEGRGHYLRDPKGVERQQIATGAVISGELEPSLMLRGGEVLPLGGGTSVTVHHVPGHTAGSVAYALNQREAVFVGDAVQAYGAASRFPGYEDPDAYRSSLEHLRDDVRPEHLYLGHPYRSADGEPYGVELDRMQSHRALQDSLDAEARIRERVERAISSGLTETDSVYSPFAQVAEDLGYTGDPTLEPSPFFTTLHGYRARSRARH